MKQHALLQRVENVLARCLLWRLRPSGGIMTMTRCRVGRRWSGNELDEEPAVLVRVSYPFVSMTAEGQDSREKEDITLNRTIQRVARVLSGGREWRRDNTYWPYEY